MAEKADKPAEFTSDEQRAEHIAALETELAHLEQSAEAETSLGREVVAATRRRRAGEVKGRLERLGARTAETRPRGAAKETRA